MDRRQYNAPNEAGSSDVGSAAWGSLSIRQRCRIVGSVGREIAKSADRLTQLCASDQRTDPVETITSELLPMCSALRRIGRQGPKILRDRRCGVIGRPAWLWGVRSVVRRVARGRVLILGTWNYPLLLMGVQAAQALAAGNRVQIKPAPGCEAATAEMVACFHRAGVPSSQLLQLDSGTEAAVEAIRQGVELIVLTGAASTGRKVLAAAAESLTPTIMELSGCDAVVITPSADIKRAVESIHFGLNFNSGATCIGPRRLIVCDRQAGPLIESLRESLSSAASVTIHPAAREGVARTVQAAIDQGATDILSHFEPRSLCADGALRPVLLDDVGRDNPIASADLFAPVISVIRVDDIEEAVEIVNACPYRLAASVFGDRRDARHLAERLDVGSIAINDLLVPTADPRLPFGGRGDSGFGVTRGDEGLLSMSVARVISERRGKIMPHLRPRKPDDAQTLIGALQLLHAGSIGDRWRGLRRMVGAVKTAEHVEKDPRISVASEPEREQRP